MENINKTLYIPLYGKARVSRRGMLLRDPKAEEIWEQEAFPIKGKAKSKWLTYYMAMRAATFDAWTREQMYSHPDAVVLHIGCGLDSRILRVGTGEGCWYDIDFPEVIRQRKRYFQETAFYRMVAGDATKPEWIPQLADSSYAIVLLEGVSMYLTNREVAVLLEGLHRKYPGVSVLMDVYTVFAARATKYKNPVNEVGVTRVYGIDSPEAILGSSGIRFRREHTMTPIDLIRQLPRADRWFFRWMFAGKATRKIYRLFEYST